jgi:hypothetical protein
MSRTVRRKLVNIIVTGSTYVISDIPWNRGGTYGKIFLAWNFWNSPSDSTPLLSVPSPLSDPVRLLANLVISFNEKKDRVWDNDKGIEVRSGSVTGLYACRAHSPVLLGRDRSTDRDEDAILDILSDSVIR